MSTKLITPEEVYQKDPQLKREDVLRLLEWADMQPHLPKINELQAILFLHSCYYSNEQAKQTLDTFYTVKSLCPELFGHRGGSDEKFRNSFKVTIAAALPQCNPEGHTVVFMKLIDFNPSNYHFGIEVRNFDMGTMLQLQQKGPSKGVELVADSSGAVFGHLTRVNPIHMKKVMYYIQEAMPIRLKRIHFINPVSFMDKILGLMKPFMKKEMIDLIHIHNDISSLYKFVPKELLPQEYGGNAGSVASLHEKFNANIFANQPFFAEEDKMTVDESKRPGKPKSAGDFFGIEGTFKKLQVD